VRRGDSSAPQTMAPPELRPPLPPLSGSKRKTQSVAGSALSTRAPRPPRFHARTPLGSRRCPRGRQASRDRTRWRAQPDAVLERCFSSARQSGPGSLDLVTDALHAGVRERSAILGGDLQRNLPSPNRERTTLRAMATPDCWRGRWALVTGASSGIGWALAEQLAAGGAHLLLTARRRQRLTQLRKNLRAAHTVQVEVLAADLEQPNAPEAIFAFTNERGIAVDLLVNNAGVGSYGEFCKSSRPRELGIVQVNCAAAVHLTHLYLPGMVERRAGDILIVASTGAYQGVPYMATYAASKAFDLLFAEGLAEEVKRYGVRVCALCPGPTVSEFQRVAGVPQKMTAGLEESAEQVARIGLRALAAGEHSVISGFTNWLGVEVQRIAPRRFVTYAAERLFRPQQGTGS
jgi:short-subunit dehydrogenase